MLQQKRAAQVGKRSGLGPAPGGSGAGLSLSNRKGKVAKNGGGVGLDRLSVFFPVTGFEPLDAGWDRVASRSLGPSKARAQTRSASIDVGGGVAVFVGVEEHPELPYVVGKVECNPSRMLDPDGWGLAPLDCLPEILPMMAAAARELMSFEVDTDDVKVARADVARDFEVRDPDAYQRALSALPRPYAKRHSMNADPSRNNALTLTVGNNSGLVRGYNKSAESHGAAPEGTLRVECEARKAWLRRLADIRSVEDLTPEKLMRLFEDRWQWSGMGLEVSALDDVIGRLLSLDLSASVRARVIGELVMMASGHSHPMSNSTRSRLNKAIREAGVVVEPGCLSGGGSVVSRLDWETGTEVVRVA